MPGQVIEIAGRPRPPIFAMLPAAKLEAPPGMPSHLPRSAVVACIAGGNDVPLTLVQAPAGFGKTTALAQARSALSGRGIATAWLTADLADNDPSRFLAALFRGIAGLEADAVVEAPAASAARRLEALLERLRAVRTPFCLFIDEFEAIRNSIVIDLVRDLLAHFPAGARLVLATRSVPFQGLARLRSRGQLVEVGPEALRFSFAETREFLNGKRGLRLTEAEVGRLHQCTEGWPTAVWLAGTTLERRDRPGEFIRQFDGSSAEIAEYLAEEVLAGLPLPLRRFLLQTSILQTLSPAACDAVCQRTDSARMLATAERSNLFLTPVDDRRSAFRFHRLFAGFLRAQLRREEPAVEPILQRRAAAWYREAGRPVPAIDHALAGGDLDFALPLLAEHALPLLGEGRFGLLLRWLDGVPAVRLAGFPLLQIVHAWAVALTRGPDAAMRQLDGLEQRVRLDGDAAAHALALRILLLSLRDDIEEATRVARGAADRLATSCGFPYGLAMHSLAQLTAIAGTDAEARRIITETSAVLGERAGRFNQAFAETVEADIELSRGQLRQATARLRLAAGLATPGDYPTNGNAKAGISLAVALYEAGEREAAERLLNVHVPLIQELRLPDSLIAGHAVLARIAAGRGDRERALDLLAGLESIGRIGRLPRVTSSAHLERARLALLEGRSGAARDELSQAGSEDFWRRVESWRTLANDCESLTIGEARYLLHTGDPVAARRLLEAALAEAVARHRGRRAIKLRALLAAARAAAGQRDAARDGMREALRSGAEEGFVQIFGDEGAPVLDLVAELASDGTAGVPAAYLTRVLGDRTATGCERAASSTAEPLTPKELRVLQLLAEGHSNLELARRLFVAETTVRTHLRNISAKLDARNRTQILAIARRRGVVA